MTDHPLTVQGASGTLAQCVGHPRDSFPASAEEHQGRLPRFPSTQRTSLTAAATPRARKSPNKLFEGFRGLGKAQTSCLKVSEGSERPKQVVSRFPRARKGPNRLFQGFRGLGKAQTGCLKVSEGSEAYTRKTSPTSAEARKPVPGKLRRPPQRSRGLGSLDPANFAGLRRGPEGSEACTRKTSPASAEASRARKPVPGKLRRPPQRPRGLGSLYPSNFAGLRRGPEGSEKGCMCVKERLSIILLINKGSKRKTHTRAAVFSIAVSA